MRLRNLTLIFVILLATLLAAACAAPATPAPEPTKAEPAPAEPTAVPEPAGVEPAEEIVVYNWSDYVAPEMYDLFTQETGIKIGEDNFSSNEDLLAKLQGGATGYSVIVPSDYTVSIMIEEGMLAELNHDNIPNLKNLDRNSPSSTTIPEQILVPYLWGHHRHRYNVDCGNPPRAGIKSSMLQKGTLVRALGPWLGTKFGAETLLGGLPFTWGYDNNPRV